MKTLIIKLGATGDVVRTTTLLHVLDGEISWVTADHNLDLIKTTPEIKRCVPWSGRQMLADEYFDLVINLEDSIDTAKILFKIKFKNIFGAYIANDGRLTYAENSSEWFDISITSKYGKAKADELKLQNRKTYQEMIFKGLGYQFKGEEYFLPKTEKSELKGDIAIAPESGSVWPMKNWAFYNELASKLREVGYTVNFLPQRDTLLEHVADVRNHRYLISGDSLPMHIALGSGIKCLTIFICTSPWEIYDYGLQKKMISPNLSGYFYRRDFDNEAPRSISLDQVYEAIVAHINGEFDVRMGLTKKKRKASEF